MKDGGVSRLNRRLNAPRVARHSFRTPTLLGRPLSEFGAHVLSGAGLASRATGRERGGRRNTSSVRLLELIIANRACHWRIACLPSHVAPTMAISRLIYAMSQTFDRMTVLPGTSYHRGR